MTIVYCLDSLCYSGGTERVTTTKVNYLAQHGCRVYILALREDKPPFFPLHPAVEVIRLDHTSYASHLAATLERLRPDIVVAVAGRSVALLPRIDDGSRKVMEFHYTKNFLVNFVAGLHRIRFRRLHILKMRFLQWRIAQQARQYDLFVGLTARDVDLWNHPRNMTYVHNPLSFRSPHKSTLQAHKIISVGSFVPYKGMDLLVISFGKIAKQFPDWTLDIYGAGQEKYYLEELIDAYDIRHQVRLLDPVKDIQERLLEASIYGFPSRSEGFGLVMTEAMECGLPIVAMDCDCSPREILTDQCGLLVENENTDAFASALSRLMSDAPLRLRMGAAAAQQVARFYPDAIMPKWLDIFQNLVNKQLDDRR